MLIIYPIHTSELSYPPNILFLGPVDIDDISLGLFLRLRPGQHPTPWKLYKVNMERVHEFSLNTAM